jgi:hypothetical protein
MRLLDMAWPVLPKQGVATGHNVVACYGREGGTMTIDAGVEAFTDFNGCGKIRSVSTPPGEVATTAHHGDYSGMARAYAALEQWCAGHGRRPTGVNWEVYGDWDNDPAKRRTDIYFLLEPRHPEPDASGTSRAALRGRNSACSLSTVRVSLSCRWSCALFSSAARSAKLQGGTRDGWKPPQAQD